MLVMVGSSVMVSLTYSFPSFLEQLILPYGYKSHDASIFGAFYNIMGILGGVIVTYFLRKNQNFTRI
jgi:cyanate permease